MTFASFKKFVACKNIHNPPNDVNPVSAARSAPVEGGFLLSLSRRASFQKSDGKRRVISEQVKKFQIVQNVDDKTEYRDKSADRQNRQDAVVNAVAYDVVRQRFYAGFNVAFCRFKPSYVAKHKPCDYRRQVMRKSIITPYDTLSSIKTPKVPMTKSGAEVDEKAIIFCFLRYLSRRFCKIPKLVSRRWDSPKARS